MDRRGLPRPHSKLGKSNPVQISKSFICADLTTWAQPWATLATEIPEVGGIQLAWKVRQMCVCLHLSWSIHMSQQHHYYENKIRAETRKAPPTTSNLVSLTVDINLVYVYIPRLTKLTLRMCLHALFLMRHPEPLNLMVRNFLIPALDR